MTAVASPFPHISSESDGILTIIANVDHHDSNSLLIELFNQTVYIRLRSTRSMLSNFIIDYKYAAKRAEQIRVRYESGNVIFTVPLSNKPRMKVIPLE